MILPGLVEQLFVGGEWVDASASGNTFDVTNPANGDTLATLPDAGREKMRRAIDAAAATQDGWAATTAAYRTGIMRRAARGVGRVFRLAENLQYGIMGANDGMPSAAQVKESGVGREGGHQRIEEYLDIKYVSVGGISGRRTRCAPASILE